MRTSLRTKLILSHLIVIFVAMAVVVFMLLTLSQRYFLNALEESLVAQAHLLSGALIPGASSEEIEQTLSPAYNAVQQGQIGNLSVQVENTDPEGSESLQPELSNSNLAYLNLISVELSSDLETRFLVLDNRGVVLVDSLDIDEGMTLRSMESVDNALGGIQGSNSESFNGEEWLFVTVPVRIDNQVVGAIHLGQPLRDITAVLSDLRSQLLLILIIALPFSAFIGLLLARNIAQPVRKLTLAAGNLSQGDYDYPLETSGKDELGQLSHTFSEMRDRLRAEERTRTQFVSDVSHELRTPLTAIKGLAETLRAGAVDDPQVRDRFLTSVEGETDRLIRLVNDLLILSRADSKALTLKRQMVDLKDLVANTIERLATHAEAKEVDFVQEFADAPLELSIDVDRIEQVLLILLDNALKASPEGENVRITGQVVPDGMLEEITGISPFGRYRPTKTWTLLSITDTGEGVDQGDLPHVFDRFYRADRSRSRDQGGSGLGLSIAKAIIDAHHGSIWLESPPRDISGGARAVFILPRQ
jgi:two-component system sensor histidine kinase BaeS